MLILHHSANGKVSTHSRPKAADTWLHREDNSLSVSTHSRPKAAAILAKTLSMLGMFQHTAARRRLPHGVGAILDAMLVSTHSRPKAADALVNVYNTLKDVSTHSRPKAAASQMPE